MKSLDQHFSALLPPELKLQPPIEALKENLRRINSPHLETLRIISEVFGARENDGKPLTAKEHMEIIRDRLDTEIKLPNTFEPHEALFCFVTDTASVCDLLNRGKKHFKKAASIAIKEKYHPALVRKFMTICACYYLCCFSIQRLTLRNGRPFPKGDN